MNPTSQHRRRVITAACISLVASVGFASTALAQAWPSKPITLIVPFPAGGTTDVLARSLAEPLAKALGQPVIVESKPGAGATIGADFVAKAKPDGYTLLVGAVHHTIATSVYKKLPYDFQKCFAPVTTIALVPNVLTVSAANPAKSVAELIAQGKASKDKLTYGSNGNGTAQHLIGTQFRNTTGTDLDHVPYKGSGPMATDLLGGQITMSFDTITPVLPHIRSGKLRALGVAGPRRLSVLPEVPTFAEAGLADIEALVWNGILAPAGTPAPVIAVLHREIARALASPDVREQIVASGSELGGNPPEVFGAFLRREVENWGRVVRQARANGVNLQ